MKNIAPISLHLRREPNDLCGTEETTTKYEI
jgi:hypothetical protein